MKRTLITVALSLLLLVGVQAVGMAKANLYPGFYNRLTTQASSVNSLSDTEYSYGTTSLFGIDGYAVNATLSVEPPTFAANSTLIRFALKVLAPFSARGTIVNESDYSVSRKTLDFYLTSGVVMDYDRSKLIDTLWLNWGSYNGSHVQEEESLYKQIYWANITKSDNVYFGRASLPRLTGGTHNATVWVRAEQDQVTTYIPFWIVVSDTIISPVPQASIPGYILLASKNNFDLSGPPVTPASVLYESLPAVNLTEGQTLRVRWYSDLILGVFVFTQEQFLNFQSILPNMQGTGNTPNAEEWADKNGISYEAIGWANRNGLIVFNITRTGSYVAVITNAMYGAASAHVQDFNEYLVENAAPNDTPNPNATTTAAPSPTIPEFPTTSLTVVFAVVATAAVLFALKKKHVRENG